MLSDNIFPSIFLSQGVIMNEEGDAVEFSPRNSRKVWSSEKKEVIDILEMMMVMVLTLGTIAVMIVIMILVQQYQTSTLLT